jgi:hypothetical protein
MRSSIFFSIRNHGVLPLDLACIECLNVWSMAGLPYNCNSIITNEQLKDLIHMIFQIPC